MILTAHNSKDRYRAMEVVRVMGWRMSRKERKAIMDVLAIAVDNKWWKIIPYRRDRKWRKLFGFGDRPRPVMFGCAGVGGLFEMNGRVWYTPEIKEAFGFFKLGNGNFLNLCGKEISREHGWKESAKDLPLLMPSRIVSLTDGGVDEEEAHTVLVFADGTEKVLNTAAEANLMFFPEGE